MKRCSPFLVVINLSLLFASFLACSEDLDDSIIPGCFQEDGRKVVAVIENAKGIIREPGVYCPAVYTIETANLSESQPLGALYACNLESEFQIADLDVVFSGYIYESYDTEDICAVFFQIREINLADYKSLKSY